MSGTRCTSDLVARAVQRLQPGSRAWVTLMIKLHILAAAAVVSAGATTVGQMVKDSEVIMDAVKGGNLQEVVTPDARPA